MYLGDIDIRRGPFEEILDSEQRREQVELNENKALGDPTIVWTFGGKSACVPKDVGLITNWFPDYIAPSHHGRGIMSAAMRLILCGKHRERAGI